GRARSRVRPHGAGRRRQCGGGRRSPVGGAGIRWYSRLPVFHLPERRRTGPGTVPRVPATRQTPRPLPRQGRDHRSGRDRTAVLRREAVISLKAYVLIASISRDGPSDSLAGGFGRPG